MPSWLATILILVMIAWATQAWCSVWMLTQVRTLFRKQRQARLPRDQQKPAAVIVPFKGVEAGLANNVAGLFAQDYADYRLLLVVESEDDEAVPVLRQAIADHGDREAQLIVAGLAGDDEGQKVHNLIAALAWFNAHDATTQRLVFADSDAVAGPNWLGDITGPLEDTKQGCVTGYRWLFPVPESGRVPLASCFASVMNASAITCYRRKKWRRPWGGSMALRRDTTEQGDLIGAMRGSISDDLSVHRMMARMGLATYFERRCLIRSDAAFTPASLWNFATRQHTIIRCMDPGTFWRTFWIPWLYTLGFVVTWATLGIGLVVDGGMAWWAVGVLLVVFAAHQTRVAARRKLALDQFGAEAERDLQAALRVDRWLTSAWMMYHAVVMLKAACSRTVVWRGNRYRMDGPNQTRRLP